MAEAIIKYSELVENDGGFEKLVTDLRSLEKTLVDKAKNLRGQISILNPKDIDALNNFADAVETLKSSYKSVQSTLKVVHKSQQEYTKTNQQLIKLSDLQGKSLADLELKLSEYRLELKKTNAFEKQGVINTKEAAKRRSELKVQIKDVTSAINKEQKEVLQSNKLTKEEIKLQQALVKIQDERIETQKQIRERISALRLVIQNTSLATEEGRQKIADYNKEIDELSDVLLNNSDKQLQNKLSIGGYTDGVVEALKQTDVFKTNISALDSVVDKLIGSLSSLTKKTDDNTEANKDNQKSISGLRKSFKGLGTTLKATGIIAVLAIIASLFSVFKQGRSGVVNTQKAMEGFNASLKVLITTLADIGKGVIGLFSSLTGSFKSFGLFLEKTGLKIQKVLLQIANPLGGAADEISTLEKQIAVLNSEIEKQSALNSGNYTNSWDKIGKAVSGFSDRVKDAKSSISTSFEGIVREFEIQDEIRKTTLELIKLKAELRSLEITSDDSTLSLRTQLEATRLALTKNLEVLNKENEILKLNLEVANAKARADLLANQTSIGARAKSVAGIQDEIKFARELLQLNIDLSERKGENPLDDKVLEQQQQALQALIQGENERSAVVQENAKKRREIERDIFEQNLDLLIDLIDKEKNISEQFVNDTTKNFKSRVSEFERFLSKFRINAQKELDEFTKVTSKRGLDLDFNVDFLDDGSFDVFIGNQKLSIDNIVELNDQLQKTGLNEIEINRFREFVQETQAAKKDTADLKRALDQAGLSLAKLSNERVVNEEELKKITELNEQFKFLNTLNTSNLTKSEREEYLKKLEEFEKRKTEIAKIADEERLRNKINSIDAELKTVQEGSTRESELINEKLGLQIELQDKNFQRVQDKLKESLENSESKLEEFAKELNSVLTEVLNRISQNQQKAVQLTEKNLDKQQDAVDRQRDRAEKGLTNTLAFEQKELAKREAEVIKKQKRLDQIQKLQSYWNTYNANLNSLKEGEDSNTAIVKTLKSIATIEAITASLASFGDGGIVEDKLPKDGIFRGPSHKSSKKGIPIMVEGKEGIFSVNEMNNLGKSNFYALKELAGRGKLDTNFFSGQKEDFTKAVVKFPSNKNLERGLKDVKRAIESKPSSSLDVVGLTNGMLKLVETTTTKNKTIRNHYKITKPRV